MPLIIPKAFAPFIDKGSNLGFPLFIWSTGYIGTPLGLGEHTPCLYQGQGFFEEACVIWSLGSFD